MLSTLLLDVDKHPAQGRGLFSPRGVTSALGQRQFILPRASALSNCGFGSPHYTTSSALDIGRPLLSVTSLNRPLCFSHRCPLWTALRTQSDFALSPKSAKD